MALGIGVLAGAVGKSDAFGASGDFKKRQRARDTLHGATKLLNPSAIQSTFQGLMQGQAGFLNSLAQRQGLLGQTSANSAIAGMSRAGFGQSGVGQALGAGLQQGAAFQGNQLRARIQQDLYNQATGLQTSKFNAFAQLANSYVNQQSEGNAGTQFVSNALQTAGNAASAYAGKPA